MLYLVTFCLPRFLDQDFDDKFITLFHELYHISPRFEGDLRRHEGRCALHSHSSTPSTTPKWPASPATLPAQRTAPTAACMDFCRLCVSTSPSYSIDTVRSSASSVPRPLLRAGRPTTEREQFDNEQFTAKSTKSTKKTATSEL